MDIRYPMDLSLRLKDLPPFEELSCLDLGCGAYASDVARQVLTFPWKLLVSVDGYEKDLVAGMEKESVIATREGRCVNIMEFEDKRTYDVVLCFDVLEHLYKDEGLALLEKIEKFATNRIVIMIPIEPDGYHRKNPDPDNVLQEHISHWRPHELEQLGYTVEILNDFHSEPNGDGSYLHFPALWAVKNK